MAKKLKDLGGEKYKEFSSISAAQKAGSIYYGKKLKSGKIKKMAAVLTSDLGKGQSLNSFMNKQLKSSRAAGMKPIVDPDGQNVGKDYYTNPEKIAGISREKMLEIIDKGTDKKPKVKAKGVNPFSSQRASVDAAAAAKPKVKVEPEVILESFVKPKIAPELSAVMAKLEEKLKGARSKAEARRILQENTSKAFSPSTMNAMLKKLEEAGMFKFKPAQPKRTPPIKKTAPKKDVAKPNKKVIQTKKRVITNAAIKKFMRKEYPERLSRIEIGDTVFFRTNAAGEPVVAMILKKGK